MQRQQDNNNMSSPGRAPLVNLSNKRRKSGQSSSRNLKDKSLKEKSHKEKLGKDQNASLLVDEAELKMRALIKEVSSENEVVPIDLRPSYEKE